MSGDGILVVLAGIGAIAWVNWYFLFQGHRRSEPDIHGVRAEKRTEGSP